MDEEEEESRLAKVDRDSAQVEQDVLEPLANVFYGVLKQDLESEEVLEIMLA